MYDFITAEMARSINTSPQNFDKAVEFFNNLVTTYADIGLNEVKFYIRRLTQDINILFVDSEICKLDCVNLSIYLANVFIDSITGSGYIVNTEECCQGTYKYCVSW